MLNLEHLDRAIERAATEHGLINLTAAIDAVKESDPEAAQDSNIEEKTVEQIRRYIEDVKGYAVEEVRYPGKRCFMILWKKGAASDPHVDMPKAQARSN